MVVAVTGRAGYNTDQEDQRVSRGGGEGGDGDDDDDAGDGRDDVRGGGRPLQPRLQCKSFLLSTILLLVTAQQSLLSSIYSLIIFTHRTPRIQR